MARSYDHDMLQLTPEPGVCSSSGLNVQCDVAGVDFVSGKLLRSKESLDYLNT